jgi:hypothetical protein
LEAETAAILGFCKVDVKPLGPLHEYVAPTTVLAARFSVPPAHTGLFDEAVGAAGIVLTAIAWACTALLHEAAETAVTCRVPEVAVAE